MRQRECDPFSPHNRRLTMDQMLDPAAGDRATPDVSRPMTVEIPPPGWLYEDAPTADDVLGQMKRVDLVRVAEERGLKTYGTRDQILARIRADEAKS